MRRHPRSQAQRHHDGLLAGLRGLLASGELGQHRGLPVTVVVSTTLKELEAATGWAPPTAAVVGWNGCPSGGGARTLSSVLRPLHWLAVAATCWILTRSSPAFILGKFNSELQGGNSSQVEPTTAGPGDRSSC
ncbi:Conserved protein of uncharacterised function possible rep13e12 repeat protein [Mycobacterium tuberculosis]|nr:Conserved protein of uncharacterised function possible rep13e12 repeat protein [Mycobacterium tuberculosis]